MFCTNCGKRNKDDAAFCTECGNAVGATGMNIKADPEIESVSFGSNWWQRLMKVIYIGLYILLPFVVIAAWIENNYYSEWEGFGMAIFTFVIYIIALRLIKITAFYIAFGQKPQWRKEFKKLF